MLATGARAEDRLYWELTDKILNLQVIGDTKEPRQFMHAVSEGFYAAYCM